MFFPDLYEKNVIDVNQSHQNLPYGQAYEWSFLTISYLSNLFHTIDRNQFKFPFLRDEFVSTIYTLFHFYRLGENHYPSLFDRSHSEPIKVIDLEFSSYFLALRHILHSVLYEIIEIFSPGHEHIFHDPYEAILRVGVLPSDQISIERLAAALNSPCGLTPEEMVLKLWEIQKNIMFEYKSMLAIAENEEVTQANPLKEMALNPIQQRIWKALDGKGLKKVALAKEVCEDEWSRLYKPNGLREMMDAGLVKNLRGIGYYRPDAPPENLFAHIQK